MRLARLGEPGAEIPVAIEGERHFDLRGVVGDLDESGLSPQSLEAVRDALSTGSLPELIGAGGLRVGAPIARPSAIICVGMNYSAHAAEAGSTPPQNPILFLKTPSSVGGPYDGVDIPRGSVKTDWEVELGVVIGTRALYLESPSESPDHIAGYLVANDLSERDFQFELSGGQWSKGKSAPGFCPLGPWLVTPDEVDVRNLQLSSWVNGELRQHSSTADLIFDVDHLVWHISQFMGLEPGDVILTGTPAGVAMSGRYPYLKPGDVVEAEIAGLGRQRQLFGAA